MDKYNGRIFSEISTVQNMQHSLPLVQKMQPAMQNKTNVRAKHCSPPAIKRHHENLCEAVMASNENLHAADVSFGHTTHESTQKTASNSWGLMTRSLIVKTKDPCSPLSMSMEHGKDTLTTFPEDSLSAHKNMASTVFATVPSMLTTLRREEAVMDHDIYLQLCLQRLHRRHKRMHSFDRREKQDYVYYNHRSKGCYIPHGKSVDTAILTYNHMFDFTDGTRFQRNAANSPQPNPSVVSTLTGTFKKLTLRTTRQLGDTKGVTNRSPLGRDRIATTSSQQPKSIRTVSANLARSLNVSNIHVTPFIKRVAVEDVVASESRYVSRSREGIHNVTRKGKMKLEEVPEKLLHVFHEEQSRYLSSRESTCKTLTSTEQAVNKISLSRYQMEEYAASSTTSSKQKQHVNYFLKTHPRYSHNSRQQVHGRSKTSTPIQLQRQHIAFTDHADRVLLGFTNKQYNGDARDLYDRSSTTADEQAGYATVQREREEKGENGDEEERLAAISLPPPPPWKEETRENERQLLLPPVAVQQLREAEWITSGVLHKTPLDSVALQVEQTFEKPLPYETSRLQFCRCYDVAETKPLPGMIHWSIPRKLR